MRPPTGWKSLQSNHNKGHARGDVRKMVLERYGMIVRRYTLFFLLLILCGCTRQAPEHTLVVADGNRLKCPLKEVDDGRVHFYTYKHEEKNINFLVRTDARGRLHTHFDACYSCYKYKMGYRVEGPDILCIACSLKYSLAKETWDFIGPCAPINLRSKVKGDYLVIDVSRLEKGKKLF